MHLFRICLEKWSKKLKASGQQARWNSKGKFVIYTAENRSLACLENLVHRGGFGKNEIFKILVIDLPDSTSINEIIRTHLPKNWTEYTNYNVSQRIGDQWLDSLSSCILKVPSSIIPQENNFLINPLHKEFKNAKIVSTENFSFDKRLYKQMPG